jgi:hypothetical protein
MKATHAAPHFHAHHGGKRASMDVDGKLIAGEIDQAAMRLVQRWAALHRDELLANWERARHAEPILAIEPLP